MGICLAWLFVSIFSLLGSFLVLGEFWRLPPWLLELKVINKVGFPIVNCLPKFAKLILSFMGHEFLTD